MKSFLLKQLAVIFFSKFSRIFYTILALGLIPSQSGLPIWAKVTISAPGLIDSDNSTAVAGFAEIYDNYAKSFSRSYAETMSFTNNLSEQVGYDNFRPFSHFSFGVMMGGSLGKTQKFSTDENADLVNSLLPKVLPTIQPSLFIATGITEKWDARMTMFPGNTISYPKNGKIDTTFKTGSFGMASKYKFIEAKKTFHAGVSIGGFFNYYSGRMESISPDEKAANVEFRNAAGYGAKINSATFNVTTSGDWTMVTFGPQIKAYYNLYFAIPYIGYSVSFNRGSMDSVVRVKGKAQITSIILTESTPIDIKVKRTAYPDPLEHVVFLGNEFSVYGYLSFGAQISISLSDGSIGTVFGTRINF